MAAASSEFEKSSFSVHHNDDRPSVDANSANKDDILGLEHVDPVINAKMRLVNDAIDEIGFTNFQVKLFCLNGFGYATDSLLLLLQSITAGKAYYQFQGSYKNGLTIAAYVGMLIGALFWGLSADIIGRKFAFNVSLMISSIFAIVAGASPNWITLGVFVCLSAFGAGGNLVLDTTVFLEYLPSKQQWLLTLMACWWGLGQLIAGLFAWAFLPKHSCNPKSNIPCTNANNMGWRYVWYASGSLVFVMSVLRVTVIRLHETPKFLVGEGRDAEVVESLQQIATKYNRPCSLSMEKMEACNALGEMDESGRPVSQLKKGSLKDVGTHLRGLFETKRIGLSTTLIWVSWMTIGLGYPLFNVFLPQYLEAKGAQVGVESEDNTWRNYAYANFSGIWGPVLAGYMCSSKWAWGRRGTMIIGAMLTMIFFFAYTTIRTNAQNVAFTCAISFCLNIYYGTLYAYTPEVLPSAHRGTGNGIAIGLNRIMGIMSAVVATAADTSTPLPLYLCASLYIVLAAMAAAFPFEPFGARSS